MQSFDVVVESCAIIPFVKRCGLHQSFLDNGTRKVIMEEAEFNFAPIVSRFSVLARA